MADFTADQKFQYKCPFRKCWVDCSNEEDSDLKQGYLALQSGGPLEITYLLNGVRFKSDFGSLKRTNVASKRTMDLRVSTGQLPFAPPPPQAGKPAPSEASKGAPDGVPHESDSSKPVLLSPEALMTGTEGAPLAHGLRKAWGHGVPEGITMSGKFSFEMKLEDKEYLGEMLTWHMMAAGLNPDTFDAHTHLKFTNKSKQEVVGNRDQIESMLTTDSNYPITVSYAPKKVWDGMPLDQVAGWELNRTFLKFIKQSVADLDAEIYNVKHKHQRRTFERYLLYLEDHYYQNDDHLEDSLTNWELYMKFPFMAGSLGLIDKTGPNLTKVMRGEADILEFLFGG